ncbi:MAG: hypothetical protein EOO90_16580 [Pedobacter sp.]|nr:MAG: hypothetical protein EOO90_16580 [Pedobacter sp.]
MRSTIKTIVWVAILAIASVPSFAQKKESPIVLRTMGSLFFGGSITKTESGETFHGDHGYAQYYIPEKSRSYPIVMWHGIGQSGKTYESTPDGREGYMSILPRRDWSVYIIDQPRRGRAGYTMSKIDIKNAVPTILLESAVWDAFRNGIWKRPANPFFFPKTQFPKSAYAVDQFFRQQAPDTGEEPRSDEQRAFMGKTMAKLLEETGPSILITHSNSGQYGWATGMEAPEKLKAIVAYEPGRVVFPYTEIPENIPTSVEFVNEALAPQLVPMDEFKKLTKMPILIIYGDNISTELTDVFNSEVWRVASKRAKQFVDAINRHGGDAKLIILPELGIYGNTHAPFADLNNVQMADLLENFLKEKGLDGRKTPHKGPVLKMLNEFTIPISKP